MGRVVPRERRARTVGSARPTTIVLWRHGLTEWNRSDRVQGQLDIGLTETGREQAGSAAARLATVSPDAIVSSDLRRAVDTAGALAALTGLPVETDSRLRERYFGQWQALSLSEIAQRWPEECARWRAGDPSPGCGIESFEDLGKRVAEALRDVADRHVGHTVVVSTHGGAARAGSAALLGWPADVARTLATLSNCHWAELRFDPVHGWQLRGYNLGG